MKVVTTMYQSSFESSKLLDTLYRLVPAVILFAFIKSLDLVEHTNVRNVLLDILLYSPLLLPFFRFGVPVYLQQNLNLDLKRKHLENVFLFQLSLLIAAQMFMLVNRHVYIILIVAVTAAMLFNMGSYMIRQGNRNGFFLQNGLLNFCLLILVSTFVLIGDYQNAKFHIAAICLFLACVVFFFISPDEFHYNWKQVPNLQIYILDTLSTFFIPLVTLLAVKLCSNAQTDFLILIKISAFISGTIGGLILLRIHSLDNENNKALIFHYKKIKQGQFKLLFLLAILGAFATYIFIPELILYFIAFMLFEALILKYGQMNILLNYKGLHKKALKANTFSAMTAAILYYLVGSIVETFPNALPLLFYALAIALYHGSCRYVLQRHCND
ncbi:hypothetical protein [Pseudoalteromonas sp.]|uniref:hypothetical protein n=1 Tax=Pseudoalteromonas sp. TaxID=53249 RepID=UPI003568D929